MTDQNDTKGDVVTVMCPCCSTLYEVPDPRALFLAMHLAHYCDETVGVLHA